LQVEAHFAQAGYPSFREVAAEHGLKGDAIEYLGETVARGAAAGAERGRGGGRGGGGAGGSGGSWASGGGGVVEGDDGESAGSKAGAGRKSCGQPPEPERSAIPSGFAAFLRSFLPG
jgi:hypothetical protein